MKPRYIHLSITRRFYSWLLAGALPVFLQPLVAALPTLQLETVAVGQIVSPIGITHAGDGSGRLFITDQRGKIHILNNEKMVLPTPFLDLGAKLVAERPGYDERGLLGFTFHPDFGTPAAAGEGRFYVYYSAPSPDAPGVTENPVDHMSVIAEYQVAAEDPNLADPASERILLTFNQPQFNHDGGQLAFGSDGLLYISTGDGGSSNDNDYGHTGGRGISPRPTDALGHAQDTTQLLGKILRIDVLGNDGPTGEYGIPAANPFAASAGSERKEIFVFGLRNPWRFSFDDGPGGSGMLFCADVGQGSFEEVNIMDPGPSGDAGGNYGWRIKEGTSLFNQSSLPDPGDLIDPVAEYAHPGQGGGTMLEVGRSVTGGHVYRGSDHPTLNGIYVFADWSAAFSPPAGTLLGMEDSGGGNWSIAPFQVEGGNPISYYVNAIGEDENGELYIAAKTVLAAGGLDPATNEPTGTILRIRTLPPAETVVLQPSKDNSIYSESENLSSGQGNSLYSGMTDLSDHRRALVAFDIAGNLPAGSQVQSASLLLKVTNVPIPPAGSGVFNLHRLLGDWGEGTSKGGGKGAAATAGDTTWRYSFFNTNEWTTLGGDFLAGPSATADAGASLGSFTLASPGMSTDVQHWADTPGENFGWILLGAAEPKSARRFGSREHINASNRPALTIEFIPGLAQTRRQEWLREYFPPGTFVDDLGNSDSDPLIDLIEYALALNPREANREPELPAMRIDNGQLAFSVRRDPRAVDLTYQIQVSPDLENWSVIASSVGGAAAAGPGFDSEPPIPGEEPLLLLTAKTPITTGNTKFVRLKVIRTP